MYEYDQNLNIPAASWVIRGHAWVPTVVIHQFRFRHFQGGCLKENNVHQLNQNSLIRPRQHEYTYCIFTCEFNDTKTYFLINLFKQNVLNEKTAAIYKVNFIQ